MGSVRFGRGLLVLACLAAVLAGVPSGTPPLHRSAGTAPATVRIMPLGASSTVGVGSPETAGYRGPLQELLARDGLSVDLVGSQRDGPDSVPDRDHEGHNGITLEQMRPRVAEWVRSARPDVVLLHNGTNDLLQGASPAEAAERLEGVLAEIARVSDAHVVVAGVWAPLPGDGRDREEFERLSAVTVAGFWERGHPMRFVDATDLLTPAGLADGLHPNARGYRRIAEMWEREILDVLAHRPGVSRPAGS
ncbi:GDSL-type esterase/lipase family protein [Pseudonocardia sichuanensis]